jgi:hypothetical protein
MKPFTETKLLLEHPDNIQVQSLAKKLGQYWSEKVAIKFTALEICGNTLLLGINDGTVCVYDLISQNPIKRVHVANVPIENITIVPTDNVTLILAGGYIYVYDLDLVLKTSVKGINYVPDGKVTSPMAISILTNNAVVQYRCDSGFTAQNRLEFPESLILGSRYGSVLCLASSSTYYLVNLKLSAVNAVFPHEGKPLVTTIISPTQFLLTTASAQGHGIGIFIGTNGDPVRGTLQWPGVPESIQFYRPYIVALMSDCTVIIHNVETLTLTQTIPLATTRTSISLTKVLYPIEIPSTADESIGKQRTLCFGVLTDQEIFLLSMVSWEEQLEQLFAEGRAADAVTLLDQVPSSVDERRIRLWRLAAFHFFAAGIFNQASIYLKQSEFDPRILLAIYPQGVPIESVEDDGYNEFIGLKDIKTLTEQLWEKSDQLEDKATFLDAANRSLIDLAVDYLEHCRSKFQDPVLISAIDTGLVKLYATIGDINKLEQIIEFSQYDNLTCESFLQDHGFLYALSLLLKQQDKPSRVLELWQRIASGEVFDTKFGGMPIIIEYLKKLKDKQLIKKQASWVLSRDAFRGIKIFIERDDDLFSPDEVLEFLEAFGVQCRIEYLEHLAEQHCFKV